VQARSPFALYRHPVRWSARALQTAPESARDRRAPYRIRSPRHGAGRRRSQRRCRPCRCGVTLAPILSPPSAGPVMRDPCQSRAFRTGCRAEVAPGNRALFTDEGRGGKPALSILQLEDFPRRAHPLAVCDATSVAFADFVPSDLVYRDRQATTTNSPRFPTPEPDPAWSMTGWSVKGRGFLTTCDLGHTA
jgi:hypothetical protein